MSVSASFFPFLLTSMYWWEGRPVKTQDLPVPKAPTPQDSSVRDGNWKWGTWRQRVPGELLSIHGDKSRQERGRGRGSGEKVEWMEVWEPESPRDSQEQRWGPSMRGEGSGGVWGGLGHIGHQSWPLTNGLGVLVPFCWGPVGSQGKSEEETQAAVDKLCSWSVADKD